MEKVDKKKKRDNNVYVKKSREKKRLEQEKQEQGLEMAKLELKQLERLDVKLDIEIKRVRRIRDRKLNGVEADISFLTDPKEIIGMLRGHDENSCPLKN